MSAFIPQTFPLNAGSSDAGSSDAGSSDASYVGSAHSTTTSALQCLLRWYDVHGVSDAIAREATDKFNWQAVPKPVKSPPPATSASSLRLKESPAPYIASKSIKAECVPAPKIAIAEAVLQAKKAKDIDTLRAVIKTSDFCPLKAGARNTVIDDGIFGADLMVLGEAPGQDEDRVGRPFVGRAGQLLDLMLASIGLSRDKDVYITNTIYWRPPGNRNPTKDETAICLPFVKRIIDLARPKFIITTGNVPSQALFPSLPGITRARGKVHMWSFTDGTQIPVLPTLHPAYLLRQPTQKSLAWQDLKTVRAALLP